MLSLLLLLACPASPKVDDTSGTTPTGNRHHPAGYGLQEAHGPDAKYQTETCTECHGADLTGGTSAISCDSCHAEGWRTDCTFCHGGTDNTTGAPPTDIDNATSDLSFAEHTVHVEETIHAPFACMQCHVEPTDVLSVGHLFVGDTTSGVAEMDFSAGLSSAGSYGGGASCSTSTATATARTAPPAAPPPARARAARCATATTPAPATSRASTTSTCPATTATSATAPP